MINTQNRLFKLARKSASYETFERVAVSKSSWLLAPYVSAGVIVTRPWLQEYYRLNKGK